MLTPGIWRGSGWVGYPPTRRSTWRLVSISKSLAATCTSRCNCKTAEGDNLDLCGTGGLGGMLEVSKRHKASTQWRLRRLPPILFTAPITSGAATYRTWADISIIPGLSMMLGKIKPPPKVVTWTGNAFDVNLRATFNAWYSGPACGRHDPVCHQSRRLHWRVIDRRLGVAAGSWEVSSERHADLDDPGPVQEGRPGRWHQQQERRRPGRWAYLHGRGMNMVTDGADLWRRWWRRQLAAHPGRHTVQRRHEDDRASE